MRTCCWFPRGPLRPCGAFPYETRGPIGRGWTPKYGRRPRSESETMVLRAAATAPLTRIKSRIHSLSRSGTTTCAGGSCSRLWHAVLLYIHEFVKPVIYSIFFTSLAHVSVMTWCPCAMVPRATVAPRLIARHVTAPPIRRLLQRSSMFDSPVCRVSLSFHPVQHRSVTPHGQRKAILRYRIQCEYTP